MSRVYTNCVFIRKKKNKSGTTSVQIIDKSRGVYRVAETIGSSGNLNEVEKLLRKAHACLHPAEAIQPPLFATIQPDDAVVENFLDGMTSAQIHTIGPELIFGTLFDRIGFNQVKEELFRHLVVARLAFPTSKLKTVDYLYRYQGVTTHEDTVYRFLDTLNKTHKEKIERIAYEHTRKTLGTVSVVFYDMTTLYFDTEDEDDLRKIGFSKDGKFQNPQIMIGLLVGSGGYPIGYDIFEGNTFEGKTLIPTLAKLQQKYGFTKPVVVADAGLLSKDNIKLLQEHGYPFILGARIKNETEFLKKELLAKSVGMEDGNTFVLEKTDGTRLIVSFSNTRKRKDAHNREKGLKKLRVKVASGKLTKTQITNRGYNKFLTLKGDIEVKVDEERVKEDVAWDGLKGYVTNTKLDSIEVIAHYGQLWQIEKAFRISKTDLRVRPIFHYKRRRIEAHLCIAFTAYSIWKELELLLEENKISMSPRRAAELTHTMYELMYTLPQSKRREKKILKMDAEQQKLFDVIHRKS